MISKNAKNRNRFVLMISFSIVLSMLVLSYASVPLYDLFCKVTGFGGTTQVAETLPIIDTVSNKTISIRFDSNVSPSLNWDFSPLNKIVNLPVGEEGNMIYRAINNESIPVIGTANFNVTPAKAGQYFMKLECFCFTEQILNPGESIEMPVSFFIDPDIYKDENTKEINQITLSYTFMRSIDQSGLLSSNNKGKKGVKL